MAHFALRLGRYDVALSCAERCLSIGRTLDDRHFIADALSMAGAALHATGQPSRALASCQEAYERALGERFQSDEQLAQRHRGSSSRYRQPRQSRIVLRAGHHAGAHAERRTRNGGHAGELGVRLDCDRQMDCARAAFTESLAMAREIGNKWMLRCALGGAAALAAASADHPTAARLHGAAQAQLDEGGMRARTGRRGVHRRLDRAVAGGDRGRRVRRRRAAGNALSHRRGAGGHGTAASRRIASVHRDCRRT